MQYQIPWAPMSYPASLVPSLPGCTPARAAPADACSARTVDQTLVFEHAMQILDAIALADSAQQVVDLLRTYVEGGDLAAALPVWWLRMPLNNTAQARQHLLGLMAIVNAASRGLDHARCAVAKQALSVFAIGLWKCEALAPKAAPKAAPQAAPTLPHAPESAPPAALWPRGPAR